MVTAPRFRAGRLWIEGREAGAGHRLGKARRPRLPSFQSPRRGTDLGRPGPLHGKDTAHSLADQLSLLLDACGYRGMLRESKAEDAAGRLDNLEELISLASSFHSPRELLDQAALATSRDSEGAASAVRLMSMHRAKGLEFDHLFLPALENGIIPSAYGDPDEERRLAYVALTRGKRRVTISWA